VTPLPHIQPGTADAGHRRTARDRAPPDRRHARHDPDNGQQPGPAQRASPYPVRLQARPALPPQVRFGTARRYQDTLATAVPSRG
jgi:hypothetical protein